VVAVQNVKPTLALTGLDTADEDDTNTYSFTVSDPGDDTYTIDAGYPTCDGGTPSDLVATASGGSFECTVHDGPATEIVALKVTDSDGASDTDNQAVAVTVTNVASVVALTGADTANEGDTETYTYTVTDEGDDPNPTNTEDCGLNATYTAPRHRQLRCTFPDGPATSVVSVYANDGDPVDNIGSDRSRLRVQNVEPSIGGFTIGGSDVVACAQNQVSVSITVADPASESDDPITGTINWGDGNTSPISGRTITQTHTYGAGTYNLTVTVTTTATEGPIARAGRATCRYTASGFLHPINLSGQRSGFKIGSTIPVKLRITDCAGAPVSTPGTKVPPRRSIRALRRR
jgi:hypothetical protein